jgi:hypothetical protein
MLGVTLPFLNTFFLYLRYDLFIIIPEITVETISISSIRFLFVSFDQNIWLKFLKLKNDSDNKTCIFIISP